MQRSDLQLSGKVPVTPLVKARFLSEVVLPSNFLESRYLLLLELHSCITFQPDSVLGINLAILLQSKQERISFVILFLRLFFFS